MASFFPFLKSTVSLRGKMRSRNIQVAEDERLLDILFGFINRPDLIQPILDNYEAVKHLSLFERRDIYPTLFLGLETFIINNKPPVVKRAFTRETLREFLRGKVLIEKLGKSLALFLLPEKEQSIMFLELGIIEYANPCAKSLGANQFNHIIQTAVRGTFLEPLVALEGVFAVERKNALPSTLTQSDIMAGFRKIYTALTHELEVSLGKERVERMVKKIYETLLERYGYEWITLFLEILPDNLLKAERVTMLSRKDLEQKVLSAIQEEKERREHAEKIAEEFRNTVDDLRNTQLAMLNILEDAKELEESITQDRDRLTGILAAMGEGLLVVDNGTRITLLNPLAGTLLGISHSQATGKKFDEVFRLYREEKRLIDADNPLVQALRNGQTLQTHLEDVFFVEGASGKRFPTSIVTNPLFKDGTLVGGVVVFRDSTEEKKLDESKVNFISVASHQLRTPLTAVRWYAEMLMSGDAGVLTDSQRQFIEEVYKGTTRLIEMVNMLLSLARVEGGRVKVEPFKIDVVSFTKTIIQELDVEIKRNNTHLLCIEPSSIFPAISLDPSMLRQVIANLLSNAIRYTPSGGDVEVAFEAAEDAIKISVRDNGIGIPLEKQSRVFEKFFRADNALAKVPEGTGLGLNLVKELVGLWGGRVWFESPTLWRKGGHTEHGGSCFYVTIPYKGMSPRLEGKSLA